MDSQSSETNQGLNNLEAKLATRFDAFFSELENSWHKFEASKIQLTGVQKNQLAYTLADLRKRFLNRLDDFSKQLESKPQNSPKLTHWIDSFLKKAFGQWLGKSLPADIEDPFGLDPKTITKIKPFFDFLYYRYWRVEVLGIQNIADSGRSLLVANHSGTVPYDGAMIKAAILNEHTHRKDARFLVEDFVYHMPFLGNLMYRIGGVRACPENARKLLNNEHLVIVFPEGVKGIGKNFSQRYKLARFGRGGFVRIAMQTKTPIVPVCVVGAEEIHPILYKSSSLAKFIGVPYIPITPTFPLFGLLGAIPFPSKWYICFGKPIPMDHYSAKDLGNDLLIHELAEKVRTQIQSMIFEILKKRRSVLLG